VCHSSTAARRAPTLDLTVWSILDYLVLIGKGGGSLIQFSSYVNTLDVKLFITVLPKMANRPTLLFTPCGQKKMQMDTTACAKLPLPAMQKE
jgi:hypothetical protein